MEAPKQDPLCLLHIVSGVQVLGRVSQIEGGYKVTKPFQLLTFRAPNGQIVGGTLEAYGFLGLFRPFENVEFSGLHVMHIVSDIPKQIEEQYLQATTGIQLARG